MSIRYRYVKEVVLNAYSILPFIDFPMTANYVINEISNCKCLSYQKFAEINHCSIDSVIQLCESKSGCTHYDEQNDRYLILFNEADGRKSNHGRRRWTKSHELGHVLCGHHTTVAKSRLSRKGLGTVYDEFETEADFFAAMFLAPFPLFKHLSIYSESDVKKVFGLSETAACNRFRAYKRWLNNEQTRFDRQLVKIYQDKWDSFT